MRSRSAALGFIFITLLVDITGWGIIIPVMPRLIEELIQGDISAAARYSGWMGFAYAGMQFLFAPILGGLSDKFGRRPVLLFSLFGFGVDYLILTFAQNIEWLFIGRIIAGITGASITTASAYIADISTPANRAQNFGMIGAAFGIGFILGPVLGGLLGHYGPRVPFVVASILCFLNWLYGYFILPESLPPDKRRPFDVKRANPVGSLLHLRKYPTLLPLISSMIFIYLAAHAVQSNWAFFGIEKFGWSERMIGISLGIVGLLIGIVQGGLIRVVIPRLGNEKSVFMGLAFYTLGLILFSLATHTWMMFVFLIPYALGGFAGPALQSIMAGTVDPDQQGELQGALTSMASATSIVGPPLMTNIFSFFTGALAPIYFPGAPFALGAVFMLVSLLLAYRALHLKRSKLVDENIN
ncbi:MAG TPA: TCR/Tet family MFS transporter [Phnomibacter sp.]|nr:TCR/Tet family MFS transporter [Phnomibacter sp.]